MTKSLKCAYDRLTKMPFPEFAECDELAEKQAELAEFDGHVAGIALKKLSGTKCESSLLAHDVARLRQGLESLEDIPYGDQKLFFDSMIYLVAIEDVVSNL